jgi:hypothetical protein
VGVIADPTGVSRLRHVGEEHGYGTWATPSPGSSAKKGAGSGMMKWSVVLGLAIAACHNAPPREDLETPARQFAMDTSVVRRLCAAPDSVLAGRATCVLRDQSFDVVKKVP